MPELVQMVSKAAAAKSWQLPFEAKLRNDLLASTDVPLHQKVPFIMYGYRPQPKGPCSLLRTIFALHNETGNIWTHLVGFGYFMFVFVQHCQELFLTEGKSAQWHELWLWVAALVMATAFCLLCSISFHLCNCTGQCVKECMYRMDLSGIAALIAMSYFTGIALGFRCFPLLRRFYLVYAAAVALALVGPLVRRQLADLTRHFICCVALGVVPALHWLCISSNEEVGCLVPYLLGMFGCYAAGAWFFVHRWPERHWPGRFDLFGHSHQIWHVFVVLAAVSWVRGSLAMRQIFGRQQC